MAQENKVLIRTTPKITPSLITYPDYESTKAADKGKRLIDGSKSYYRQRLGRASPLVKIGNAILPDSNLKGLTLRQEGLVPEITITFNDHNFLFTTRSFPLSNIIVSVFVQSNVAKLKSFSGDFIINSISSIPIPNTTSVVYTLSGELYIPKFHGTYSNAYRNMTSTEVLQKVAEELELGFADNQADGTDDAMTWINPNDTYEKFIMQIQKYAYKNDNNFFDCFIDRYYTLNFVNVEKQFARDEEIDTGYVSRDQSGVDKRRIDPEQEIEDAEVEVPIILTNYPETKGGDFYISDFSLISNHGEILKKYAVRRYVYWYDHGSAPPTKEEEPSEELEDPPFRKHYLDPLTSTVTNDGKRPQTTSLEALAPVDENDPTVIQSVWSGIDYGNAHPSYKFADLLNHQNRLETEKNLLSITLEGFSVNLLRGSRVRVEIFLDKKSATFANALADDQDPEAEPILNELSYGDRTIDRKAQTLVEDKSLSDFYYVKAVTYSYKDGKFLTHALLSKRHWLLPLAKNETPQ